MLPDLTQYMWIVWLVLALVFVIVELLTLEFTFLMLAGGTLIGGLGVNLLGGAWWLQVLAAAASMLSFHPQNAGGFTRFSTATRAVRDGLDAQKEPSPWLRKAAAQAARVRADRSSPLARGAL